MDDHMVEAILASSKSSWTIIDKIASTPNGLAFLSEKFKACKPLKKSQSKNLLLKIVLANQAKKLEPDRGGVGSSTLNQMGLILNHKRLFLKESSELKDCLAQTYTADARPKSSLNP
ncbi:hypothetical protein OIU74_028096 [Salix koriyanagi]|uniref:Uncharacterized protein n=1 Tax=Salix koriyanagi TaxID=2511006 RepID=A0A9Q0ZSM4_9ROSI|nr:hypothetical protein OIU74_028096 [Salix koriyanagi]